MADRERSSKAMSDRDICRDFAKSGTCRFEGNCRFKHPGGKGGSDSKSGDSKRTSTSETICKDYSRGHCEFGSRCRFKHPVPCKDFLQGKCTYTKCRYFHPPGPGPIGNGGPPVGMKRSLDYDSMPPEICRDYVEAGVCRRPRCSYLHEMPPKRRSMGGPPGPSYSGLNDSWNGHPPVDGPTIVTPEMKAYVSQLELKLTHYEDKIRDLEKRCVQYEDFNKLLTERNEELKAKLEARNSGMPSGYGQQAPNRAGGYY